MRCRSWAGAGWVSLLGSAVFAAAEVGAPAPSVEPTEWLNTPGAVSWSALKGRLILLERWATT